MKEVRYWINQFKNKINEQNEKEYISLKEFRPEGDEWEYIKTHINEIWDF